MIVPILNGLLAFRQAPITWILFLFHTAIYFFALVPALQSQVVIDHLLDDETYLRTQGRLYAQYISRHQERYSDLLKQLAEKAQSGSSEKLQLMGSLAIRNAEFMNEGPLEDYRGDQVEIRHWRKEVRELQASKDRHPSYILGLTSESMGLSNWLSYIFVHSGPYHYLGNMFFLLIFGSMLEPIIGGLALLVVFITSGMVAAGTFLLLTGATAAPLIGASGAVSGLMGLFCWFFWRTPVRYMYFLLPSVRYVGFIFLPAWTVLVMFLLSDLAGYFGAVADFGGVAYTAHLGGECVAMLIGFVISILRYGKPPHVVAHEADFPVGRPISISEMVLR